MQRRREQKDGTQFILDKRRGMADTPHVQRRRLWIFHFDVGRGIARSVTAAPRASIAGSSNGRTADSGSAYWGSNPCPAANPIHLALSSSPA